MFSSWVFTPYNLKLLPFLALCDIAEMILDRCAVREVSSIGLVVCK